jgi:outer membrane protein assembly factor BamA
MDSTLNYSIKYAVIAATVFLCACNTIKDIPEGQYLLEKVSIKTDSGFIDTESLMELVQQKPPVVFSQRLMNQTLAELSIEAINRGFLRARVHAALDTSGRRISAEYHIHEGSPYRIKNYEINLGDTALNKIVSHRGRGQRLKLNSILNMSALDREMNRVSARLRNNGYYRLTADNLHFIADTALQHSLADLKLILQDTSIAKVYAINSIRVFSGYDRLGGQYLATDSTLRNGINIYYDRLHFLRPKVIVDKIPFRPGDIYRQRSAEAAYSLFQSLNCVNYANIEFKEGNYSDSTLLDCNIFLSPGDNHTIQAGFDATNKAGDFGLAFDLSYVNQNTFNGSELFGVSLKSAYEFVNSEENKYSNHNFFEIGITPSLTFSKIHFPWVNAWIKKNYNAQTLYSLGFNIQHRPQFTRNFYNLKWQFRWSGRSNILTQTLSPIDINYVFMPWVSDEFKRFLNTRTNPVTRYSYEDVFTVGSAYGLIYTNSGANRPGRRLYTVRLNMESSGNMLNAIFSIDKKTPATRQYNVFGNPFAQYVKGDIDLALTIPLSTQSSLAFHAGAGAANPYNNSSIMPFEKRYYAGGPNNVRGWNTRCLGPGSMPTGNDDDIALHVGDISMIVSAEYRIKAIDWIEPALFVDCGNIWTIREYSDQTGGLFRWNSFYKELAVGSGLGLRFDFKFLIFRIDAGKRVYDPAMPENKRFVLPDDSFWENWKLYLAIGYPF